MTEREQEMFAAAGRVKQQHLDRLNALGASPGILALGPYCPPFGVANGVGELSGIFLPGDGPAYIVQPVVDDGVMVDLVYWRTLQPERWWLRTGAGWALNPAGATSSVWKPEKPVLHASPLDWLRAGATGSVILDWEAPGVRQLLAEPEVICGTLGLATTLDRALRTMIRFPKIVQREVRNAA